MLPMGQRRNGVRNRRNLAATQVSSWVNFTPLSLSPQLWLDAADTTTITESGGAVSQWNDKSGNGYQFTQATAAAQPKTGTRTQNGLNVLDFDGGDSLVSTAAASTWNLLHNGTVHLLSMVVARDVAGTSGTVFATTSAASNIGATVRFLDSNNYSHVVNNVSGAAVVSASYSSGTSTSAVVLGLFSDPGNGTAANRSIPYINRSTGPQNNASSGTPSANDASVSMAIGNRQVNALALDGFIAELIIVGSANATTQNLLSLQRYLVQKWGTA